MLSLCVMFYVEFCCTFFNLAAYLEHFLYFINILETYLYVYID